MLLVFILKLEPKPKPSFLKEKKLQKKRKKWRLFIRVKTTPKLVKEPTLDH
jgi:hypothetical protein